MTFRRAFVAASLLLAFAAARPATGRAQGRERSLYVSVLDQAGAPVTGLGDADFVVREDNVAREVLRVVPADTPMQVAVLVDDSVAARENIRDIRQGITEFINAMLAPDVGVKHQIAIIGLANRPTILADYTSDKARLMSGVGRIFAQPDSGTYLMDGIIETSQGLSKRAALRPIIVAVITDGPELSNRNHDQVIEPLQANDIALHAIVIGPISGSLRDEQRERGIALDRGTQVTGGRYDNILTSMALTDRMKQVAAELTNQYRVTYARPESLIPPDRITVSTTRPGLTARGTPVKPEREQRRP